MKKQRVLVTAGAAGIGREIARAFAASGAAVFVCDIDAKGLDALAREIAGLKTTICDVSKPQDIERMVTECAEALGGLDVLVNNAGIAGPTAPVEEMDPDQWEKVMRVDLTGTFNVTRVAIPHLKNSEAGVIINMSSVAGRFGYRNRSPYWEGPRIQQVFAGRAKASGRPVEEIKQEAMAVQSLKRMVDPKDIASLAVFLASDAAKSISGQMLPIDNDMQAAS